MALRFLLLVAVFGLAVGLVSGGVAIFYVWKGAAVDYQDATPSQVWKGAVPSGSAVWLRGLRDESSAVTLGDGRVLYPTRAEPRVLVDCGDTGCEGTLVGRVEDVTLEGPPPESWPDGAGRRARVVVVGEPSDDARSTTKLAAMGALLATGVGIASAGAVTLPYAGRRRR